MQGFLKKHGSQHARHLVKVVWSLNSKVITIDFTVQKRIKSPWYYSDLFSSDYHENQGLWDFDVVEAFLQPRSHIQEITADYLELQVSPLNQPFVYLVQKPRQIYEIPTKLNFSHDVIQISEAIWKTQIKLEIPSSLGGQYLFGGFFSCLEKDNREFYALEPNKEKKPDFHRPDLFLPLGELL